MVSGWQKGLIGLNAVFLFILIQENVADRLIDWGELFPKTVGVVAVALLVGCPLLLGFEEADARNWYIFMPVGVVNAVVWLFILQAVN
jgi:hypothetical protein